MMRRERPSSDEPKQLLPVKVSGSLAQALSKLDLSPKDQPPVHGSADTSSLEVSAGTTCKNSGCKAVINVEKSFLNMLPSKVEITLKKENAVTWARLEHPQSKPQTLQQQLETDSSESQEARGANPEEESDDSLSWSEEEEGEERVEGERSQALPASHVSDGK
nr:integrin beta-1-binding protein 2-like isoform X2 [Zootoca vivipara]